MWRSDARYLGSILALAALIALAFLLPKLGRFLMRKLPIAIAFVCLLPLAGACTTVGALGALQAAGLTIDAYCQLTPEGRAEIRDRLNIEAQLIRCPSDVKVYE